MTEENQEIRDVLKRVEAMAEKAIRHQPAGDDDCSKHLTRALIKIANLVGAYRGIVEVDVSDIKWDTDDNSVDLPQSVCLFMDQDNFPDMIADELSDKYGWLVESFTYEVK